jgi:hypothetical protein
MRERPVPSIFDLPQSAAVASEPRTVLRFFHHMSRTGIAAILAGVLFFAGQAGELVFGSPSDLVDGVFVGLVIASFVALAIALWGLREVIAGTRVGRIGMRLALAGVGVLGLFAVQLVVELIRTGDIPDNFLLFGIGFLLILVGQVLFARDLRPALGPAWVLPIVAVVGLVMALFLNSVGLHDIGLFVFEGAWIALGIALLRTERQRRPETTPVVA